MVKPLVVLLGLALVAVNIASPQTGSSNLKESLANEVLPTKDCVQIDLCIIGYSWNSEACKCVKTPKPKANSKCIDNVMCAIGYTWSKHECKCECAAVTCASP